MDFEKILETDTLNQGRIKINNILDAAKSQVSELKEDLGEIYPTLVSTNKFDKSKITVGFYYDDKGKKIQSDNWFIGDLMPIKPNTKYAKGGGACALYDADKNFVKYIYGYETYFTTDSNVRYFGATGTLEALDSWQLNEGVNEGERIPPYMRYFKKIDPAKIGNYVVVDKSGNGDYTSLTEAVMNGLSKTIYVRSGLYNLIEEFESKYGSDFFTNYKHTIEGLVLNGHKLYLDSGSKVIFNYTGTNQDVIDYFSPFIMQGEGGEIHGGEIVGINCRYTINDDVYTTSLRSKSVISGCIIRYQGKRMAIGGGVGQASDILVENNYVETTNTEDISPNVAGIFYHNTATGNSFSNLKIINNVLEGTARTILVEGYGTSTNKSIAIVTGNRCHDVQYLAYDGADNFECYFFNNDTMRRYYDGYIDFTVKVNQFNGKPYSTANALTDQSDMVDVDCMISLPKNYSQSGKKVPLIMMCHGAGQSVKQWRNNTGYNNLVTMFKEHGYAVFDCNGFNNTPEGYCFWGANKGIEAWRKAYDYVVENYNVEREFSIYAFSMGGLTSMNLMFQNFPNIKCMAIASPVLKMEACWNDESVRPVLKTVYDIPQEVSEYDSSYFTGTDPWKRVVEIDNKKYCFAKTPPIKIWYGSTENGGVTNTGDNTTVGGCVNKYHAQQMVEAITNAGGYAYYREVDGCGHEICYGENSVINTEYLIWINRFNNKDEQ